MRIAVAVSGGPDSMALVHALYKWGCDHGRDVAAVTVDHGLRTESADEARQVSRWIDEYMPHMPHEILTWQHDEKPQGSLQEAARKARYALMADWCANRSVSHLALAHHQDDQAETVLMRLCAGSGLNGLAGMRVSAPYNDKLTLLRPLLSLGKADLLAYCQAHNLPYVEDPSNQNDKFERVRLRQSWPVLEAEGLSAKRLATTAKRLARGNDALDFYTQEFWSQYVAQDRGVTIESAAFQAAPAEISMRAVMQALRLIGLQKDYAPRMEKTENLVQDLRDDVPFRKRTLGGAVLPAMIAAGKLSSILNKACA